MIFSNFIFHRLIQKGPFTKTGTAGANTTVMYHRLLLKFLKESDLYFLDRNAAQKKMQSTVK